MFTGIIRHTGKVISLRTSRGGKRLAVSAPEIVAELKIGDSLAVNGVCLTLVGIQAGKLEMDVLDETLRRSNLGRARPGEVVNLERALRVGEEIGGHLITGHIDGRGRLVSRARRGRDWELTVALPAALLSNVVEKGSIAVEGVSLTVAAIRGNGISVHIVPHTWEKTSLGAKSPGAELNIETDILGKHAAASTSGKKTAITSELLKQTGFI